MNFTQSAVNGTTNDFSCSQFPPNRCVVTFDKCTSHSYCRAVCGFNWPASECQPKKVGSVYDKYCFCICTPDVCDKFCREEKLQVRGVCEGRGCVCYGRKA